MKILFQKFPDFLGKQLKKIGAVYPKYHKMIA